MSTISTIDAESTDLKTHVELCAQRYESLDNRLVSVDNKIDSVNAKVEQMHGDLWKVLISTIGTVLVSIISAISVIWVHLK